jgi:DNA primase small subunit
VGRAGRRGLRPFKRLPPPDAPGWPGRISRSFHRTLAGWVAAGASAAAEDLVLWGADPKEAKRLAKQLVTEEKAQRILETGSLEVFSGEVPKLLLETVLLRATIAVQGETDAPVTTDLHRLIRLPGSLHGGTGFRVTPIPRERLEAFDPFRDAVAFVGNGSTEVVLTERIDHPFPERLTGAPGEVRSLPDAQAIFLVLRGEATLPSSPAR